MQGTIIQTLGLALAVNARLRGEAVPRFWPDGSIFTFCGSVRFVEPRTRLLFGRSERVIAEDPAQWLDSLAPGTRGARVLAQPRNNPANPDYMSVGMVGGGSRWLVEIVGDEHSQLWADRWELGKVHARKGSVWKVTYVRLSSRAATSPPAGPDLEGCRRTLVEALEGIAGFSAAHDFGYLDLFADARERLEATDPLSGQGLADMVPDDLSLAARQLLAASQAGWVFGGMGSWNDRWVDGAVGEEYAMWSSRLFDALQESARAAVNSSFPGA
jgi:hypothetical protein